MDQMWRHRRAASRAEPMARELASNEPMAFGVILQASLSLNLNQTNNFFAVSILIRFSSKYFSTHFVFFPEQEDFERKLSLFYIFRSTCFCANS